MKRVVSGIQTSGVLHLGNYLGAIKNWKIMQQNPDKECIFFLADNHSITLKFIRQLEDGAEENTTISDLTINTAACLLACGLDTKKSPLFVQSEILEHSELMWILSCMTPLSWLNKMIQYKEKSKNSKFSTTGLYTYPILMAADILLYKAEEVPVGEDQTQHIEVARDIAIRLNKLCKADIVPIPNYIIPKHTARVMSLQNGKTKMSKSDKDSLSCISLTDTEDIIKQKVMKAKTDSITNIYYDTEARPEVSNLLAIYSSLEGISMDETVKRFEHAKMVEFKQELISVLNREVLPITIKANKLISHDRDYIRDVLRDGKQRAKQIAEANLCEIKRALNYLI
jgi:tryptophanyl-tRNA synthetase